MEDSLVLWSPCVDDRRIQGLTSGLRKKTEPLPSFFSAPPFHVTVPFNATVSEISKYAPSLSPRTSISSSSAIFD
jgi:hypothetical protein